MDGDEAEEEVDGTSAFGMSSINISGRSTLFSCLSCGMPFSFPDESYTSDDKNIQEMLLFVHTLRLEIRRNDKSKASTVQWQVGVYVFCPLAESTRTPLMECIPQANKSHYLHKFLHGNIVMHTSFLHPDHLERIFKQNRTPKGMRDEMMNGILRIKDENSEKARKRRNYWDIGMVKEFNKLIDSVRFKQGRGGNKGPANMCFVLDEKLMQHTSDWCTACNLAATHHIPIKDFLFGTNSIKGRAQVQHHMSFLNVPDKSSLPLGMRLMNDAYVFMYTVCSFIAVMLKNLESPTNDQTRVWRLQGLVRLYVGYLLFVLSDQLNAVKRPFAFEHWYMFYFSDVQLWERKRKAGDTPIYSNLMTNKTQAAQGSMGTVLDAPSDAQITEIVKRVTSLAKEYWFLLDQVSLEESENKDTVHMPEPIRLSIQQYLRWLPFDPNVNAVSKMYLSSGLAGAVCCLAPAPFCCSKRVYDAWQPMAARKVGNVRSVVRSNRYNTRNRGDQDDYENIVAFNSEDQEQSVAVDMAAVDDDMLQQALATHGRAMYVDKHLFLHRLYVGLDTQFRTRPRLHKLLQDYLPETHAALMSPSQVLGRAGLALEQWERDMEASLQAARNSLLQGIPQFHWSLAYRM